MKILNTNKTKIAYKYKQHRQTPFKSQYLRLKQSFFGAYSLKTPTKEVYSNLCADYGLLTNILGKGLIMPPWGTPRMFWDVIKDYVIQ